MPITLVVEEYCHQCSEFEAEVIKPEIYYTVTRGVVDDHSHGDTKVKCCSRKKCENIKNHLEFNKIIDSL